MSTPEHEHEWVVGELLHISPPIVRVKCATCDQPGSKRIWTYGREVAE